MPKETVAELITLLVDRFPYIVVLLNATPADFQKAEQLRRKFSDRVYVIQYSPEVLNFCALVKLCNVVISPDTAIVHIAETFDIPVVGLYKNSREHCDEWGVHHQKSVIIMSDDDKEITSISAQKVFEAFVELNEYYQIV